MKTDITARFDSSDTAQRIAVYINELYGKKAVHGKQKQRIK